MIVDLELDVIRRPEGDVLLDDEDEFELHARTLQYPRELVSTARATASMVLAAVAAGDEPFGEAPTTWLQAGHARAGRAKE